MEFFAGIGAGWMNLASLALGLLAWMLPVAAMIRTSTGMVLVLPTLRISFSWSTRSSWACRSKGMSPISSRKMVPVWANSNRPFFPPFLAPVKEPSS